MKKMFYVVSTMLLCQLPLLAQGEEDAPIKDQGMWQTGIMIGIFLLFFYFMLLRPEQKRRKAADDLRAQIKRGDRVTAMGIIGTISKIQDNTFILKMYDGSEIEVLKGAVTDVISGNDEEKKSIN